MTLNGPQRLQAICKENDDEDDDDHVKPSPEHVLEGSAIQALSVDILLSLHTYPQSDHDELPSRHGSIMISGRGVLACRPAKVQIHSQTKTWPKIWLVHLSVNPFVFLT